MDSPHLVHATTAEKAKAIQMVGFRIGPRTRRATGFCARNDFDCQREQAYLQSEAVHEDTRRKVAPNKPTRQNATFFAPKEGYFCVDDPKSCVTGEDDQGRPQYDFGFGKDALFVVDATKIPCACGVGDGAKGDETFAHFMSKSKRDPVVASREFWSTVEKFDWRKYDPYRTKRGGDPRHEIPEIWCPCPIPRSAIIAKYDKNNPLSDR